MKQAEKLIGKDFSRIITHCKKFGSLLIDSYDRKRKESLKVFRFKDLSCFIILSTVNGLRYISVKHEKYLKTVAYIR